MRIMEGAEECSLDFEVNPGQKFEMEMRRLLSKHSAIEAQISKMSKAEEIKYRMSMKKEYEYFKQLLKSKISRGLEYPTEGVGEISKLNQLYEKPLNKRGISELNRFVTSIKPPPLTETPEEIKVTGFEKNSGRSRMTPSNIPQIPRGENARDFQPPKILWDPNLNEHQGEPERKMDTVSSIFSFGNQPQPPTARNPPVPYHFDRSLEFPSPRNPCRNCPGFLNCPSVKCRRRYHLRVLNDLESEGQRQSPRRRGRR